MLEKLKLRLKNPKFKFAAAALIYQALHYILKKYYNIELELGKFQMVVDMLSFGLLGVGIYTTFDTPSEVLPSPVTPEPVTDSSNEVTVTTEQP